MNRYSNIILTAALIVVSCGSPKLELYAFSTTSSSGLPLVSMMQSANFGEFYYSP